MARIEPLPPEQLTDHAERFALVESFMGFVPNSMQTMARIPGLVEAFGDLGGVVLANPRLPVGLTQMVAHVASNAAGCRYCQAHTAHTAGKFGVPDEKLADLWNWEESEHFDDAERAALTLAFHAGSVPNVATEADFAELRQHFDDDQIAGLVAVISLFGYLNRWNDTTATELEDIPSVFGQRVLATNGWESGKHA
jgi:alkylhydroperoxidase family enzyme